MNKGKYTMPQCETDINALKNGWVARWIPVTERLPKKEECYLITSTLVRNDNGHKTFYTNIAKWEEGQWVDEYEYPFNSEAVIAWMPLPDPYEEEQ